MRTIAPLQTHLEQVFGSPVDLAPVPGEDLPYRTSNAYTLWRGELLGRAVVFACVRRPRTARAPKRLRADARAIGAHFAPSAVALVMPRIEAHVRRRLIAHRVPFVVPGRQLFLPDLGVDLHERDLGPPRETRDHFEWAAQVTVLRHLLAGDIEDKPLRAVAALLGYSAMTLSNVKRQLIDAEIATVETHGRAHVLHCPGTPRETWEAAVPHLRSPARRTTTITAAKPPPGALAAGMTALAQATDLADANLPTVALGHRQVAEAQRAELLHQCPDEEAADFRLETWNYDARLLATGDAVDRLSLYLSVREIADARVEQAAEQLLEQVRW